MLNTKELIKLATSKKNNQKLSKTNQRVVQGIKKIIKVLKNKQHFTDEQINIFLNKLPNKLKKSNHDLYNLSTHRCIAMQGTGKISKLNRPHWLSNGKEINGECITTKVAEAPYNAKQSILSNILLENVPKQYYIDRDKLKKILKQ